jgi:hypothetical protein
MGSAASCPPPAALQPPIPPWLTEEMLRPLIEINELALQLLCRHVREPHSGASAPAMLRDLEGLWCALDERALQQVARCPYVLIDGAINRADVTLARIDAVRDAQRVAGFFAGADGRSLARRYATFCWHLARTHRLAARMLLGMSAQGAERVRGLTLRELEQFADAQALVLRPRWPERADVWRALLTAALQYDRAAIERARLRGLQLLATEDWPD